MLVNAGDLGRDYEHCLELQKKVNNLESAVSCMISFSYSIIMIWKYFHISKQLFTISLYLGDILYRIFPNPCFYSDKIYLYNRLD